VLAPILPRFWACSSFGAEAEAMRENWIDPAPIAPAMDVRDADRAKIGTVARVHAPVAVGGPAPDPTAPPGVVEVKTGPLGLEHHLCVPLGAVLQVTAGGVFLRPSGRAIEAEHPEWRARPPYPVEPG
jgi:hypothetical protein